MKKLNKLIKFLPFLALAITGGTMAAIDEAAEASELQEAAIQGNSRSFLRDLKKAIDEINKKQLLSVNPEIILTEDETLQLRNLLKDLKDEKIITLVLVDKPFAKETDPLNPLLLIAANGFIKSKTDKDGEIILLSEKVVGFCINPKISLFNVKNAKKFMENLNTILPFLRGLNDSEKKREIIEEFFLDLGISWVRVNKDKYLDQKECLKNLYGEEIAEKFHENKLILCDFLVNILSKRLEASG